MTINKKKINNLVVRAAPKWGGDDPRPPRGEKLFKTKGCNVYASAKKHSGKTSNVFFILRRIMGPNTKLIIYAATAYVDPTWKFIIKYFKAKGHDVEVHTSLKENGVDLLAQQVKELEKLAEADDTDEEEELTPKEQIKQKGIGMMNAIMMHNLPHLTGNGEEKPKKPKKSKYNERERVWVLDDLSTELKTKSLVGLLKKSRHFGSVLLSSQYWLDLDPQSRAQIDYGLIYGGQREDKLEIMWKDFDLKETYDQFKELYDYATEEKYSFLYVDVREDSFRKNFNEEINITTIK